VPKQGNDEEMAGEKKLPVLNSKDEKSSMFEGAPPSRALGSAEQKKKRGGKRA